MTHSHDFLMKKRRLLSMQNESTLYTKRVLWKSSEGRSFCKITASVGILMFSEAVVDYEILLDCILLLFRFAGHTASVKNFRHWGLQVSLKDAYTMPADGFYIFEREIDMIAQTASKYCNIRCFRLCSILFQLYFKIILILIQ